MNIVFKTSTEDQFDEILSHSFGGLDSAPRKNIFLDLIHSDAYYTAYVNDIVVGSFSYSILWDDTIMVQFLRVKPEYRKKGIARKMVNYIEDIGRKKGCDVMLSTVLTNNSDSGVFHEKIGFRKAGNIEFEREEYVYLRDIDNN